MHRIWRLLLGACAVSAALAGCRDDPAEQGELSKAAEEPSLPAVAASNTGAPLPETEAFDREVVASFDHPWAIEFEPGSGQIPDKARLFITHRDSQISVMSFDGKVGLVRGVPAADRGGQDGLGDLIFAHDYRQTGRVFLSWVENDGGRKRGAVVGVAKLECAGDVDCALTGLQIIWKQSPKTSSFGHYSYRLVLTSDGSSLYISSGDRRQIEQAQNNANNLGTIVKIELAGRPAPDNPFAQDAAPTNQIWSMGHRNVLGLAFDSQEHLWAVEHGPIGGDEFNLVKPGQNYGWPLVANGTLSNGDAIPAPETRPDLTRGAISWTPVIAPSDMIIYDGNLFQGWHDNALITGLKSRELVRVKIDGETATEIARYPMGDRIRSIAQAPDGAIWVIEEGQNAQLIRLTPAAD